MPTLPEESYPFPFDEYISPLEYEHDEPPACRDGEGRAMLPASPEQRKPLTFWEEIVAVSVMLVIIGLLFGGGYLVGRTPQWFRASQESVETPPGRSPPRTGEDPSTATTGTSLPGRVPETGAFGPKPSVSKQEFPRSFELPATSPYKLVYTRMGAGKIPSVLRTSAKYRMWVPTSLTSAPNVSADAHASSLEPLLQEAFREVEAVFGPFANRVEVYVVDEIPHLTNANKSCLGIAWWESGKPHIAIRSRYFSNRETVAVHELVHLRIEERGFRLPPWLEEGFCHFSQAADGRSETCLPQFENFPKIQSYAELAHVEDDDWSARAMGWALVHFWLKEERRGLADALTLGAGPVTGWPSPEVVRAYARGFRRGLAERDLTGRP